MNEQDLAQVVNVHFARWAEDIRASQVRFQTSLEAFEGLKITVERTALVNDHLDAVSQKAAQPAGEETQAAS